MAREIRIFEEVAATAENMGFVRMLYVFRTNFERDDVKFAKTPLADLPDESLVQRAFNEAEQALVESGELSWEVVEVVIPKGYTREQRTERIRKKYTLRREQFKVAIEDPVIAEVEFVDLNGR